VTLGADLFLRVPVTDLVLLVVAIAAGLSIVQGFTTARRELLHSIPLIAALLLGTTAVWVRHHGGLTTLASQLGPLAVLAALLVLHFVLDRRSVGGAVGQHVAPNDLSTSGSKRSPWMGCLLVALILAGALLSWRLTTFASSTLVWESPVTEGFGEAFHADIGVARYALRDLVWNEGLVSNGQDSLLYGAPTYALMRWLGFSTLSLRICAVMAGLLFVAAMWAFARRHFGDAFAGVAALVTALSTYTLFYGKYGTSLARPTCRPGVLPRHSSLLDRPPGRRRAPALAHHVAAARAEAASLALAPDFRRPGRCHRGCRGRPVRPGRAAFLLPRAWRAAPNHARAAGLRS
jgi:hypothetical protein